MNPESNTLTIPPHLYSQYRRLKTAGRYLTDAAMIQACFNALEMQWTHRLDESTARVPYMPRPALSIEDYDT